MVRTLQDIESYSLTAPMGWGRVSDVPYARRRVAFSSRYWQFPSGSDRFAPVFRVTGERKAGYFKAGKVWVN